MSPDRGLDRLLDRAVLPGYSRLGHAIRRRGWYDEDPPPSAMAAKTALVTGAGGGLGEAVALELARLGARVGLVVRSAERAAPAMARISETLKTEGIEPDLRVEQCDVSDLAAVSAFAEEFGQRGGGAAVDVLVHNAGVMPPERTESVDGHELTVATHVLGPVLLTELLRPSLGLSPEGARVIFVASGGMYTQSLPVDDPDFERGAYRGAVAYARSKRMQVELVPLLARRWAADRVSAYAMHPGWVDTPGIARSLPAFRALLRPLLRSPAAGADTAVWLAAKPTAPASGGFWHDRRQRPTSYRASTRSGPDEVERLWRWVEQEIGLSPGRSG